MNKPIKPIDFDELKTLLPKERDIFIKTNAFSEEEHLIRNLEDAKNILEVVKKIHTDLYQFFKEYPSLIPLFEKSYGTLGEFFQRESVIDLCFFDNVLFPEKELFCFVNEEDELDFPLLESYHVSFIDWIAETKKRHEETDTILRDDFSTKLHLKNLSCACVDCTAIYRTKLRESVFADAKELILSSEEQIKEELENISSASSTFYEMRRNLDKLLFKLRSRLRRSTLNKLETQIKHEIKTRFCYPQSELAQKYSDQIHDFLRQYLKRQNLKSDLISKDELNRFLKQLSTNIWRPEKYLEREFKKFVNSIFMLKRKDISATILKEYLGAFWIHARARRINRKIIYHMGPTNSGKTYHAIEALASSKNGCYLAPLRLLAAELYDTLNNKGVVTTLLTGEEIIELDGATHYSSTVEMARFNEDFDCCVIDEIQMMSDSQRGWAWTRALVNIHSPEVHICGDGSVLELVQNIATLCGDTLEIKNYERMTDLKVQKRPLVLPDMDKNDALIVFSRKNALRYKSDLEHLGYKVSIVYGRLSPEVRREQARKFDQGETDIIVATDAIAMGMNLPIKRIIFSTLSKFFNSQEYRITHSEIKQISGRAGRFGRFPTGYVTCLTKEENGIDDICDALEVDLPQKTEAMVGPDLDIFAQVNDALRTNSLPELTLSEFLRLFNTMTFRDPFYCVDLSEMIELAEMVEEANEQKKLLTSEIFGFACAPVNQGLPEHVNYFVWILNRFANGLSVTNEEIDHSSNNIDYLETSIKCVELYQWLSRHFNNKNFDYDLTELLANKGLAIEKLNTLLSDKIAKTCNSCGEDLPDKHRFHICENCFQKRRTQRFEGGRRGKPAGQRSKTKSSNPRRSSGFKKGKSKKVAKSFSRSRGPKKK